VKWRGNREDRERKRNNVKWRGNRGERERKREKE
jgi:hypothetical protein